ncbi:SAM-dependent methyltransferase [Kribbella sindirgiensis]|uniref:SAM-dependent methyltransferase n=1 Tax=Kribbella sindirgiensis TaxID=1124744 RepID=A0A4R0IBE4_9ACTN|nr:SAM-dependent methyltransferase [Kribbella sindirgiensis]TCC30403.1 SAM-dependent methyltransferase [Kribbella sindirgiensis]
MDWRAWHEKYDDPESELSRRLQAVQTQVRAALDRAPAGPVPVISLCAGQGRDLLDVLEDHPRRADVRARLVELDPELAAAARERAPEQVEVVTGDASLTDHYVGLVPAEVVLLCGIFGNITSADIERTVAASPQLCRTGGTVIWTRHREDPDLVPTICGWFEDRGFEWVWVSDKDAGFGVGVHRFTGVPEPLVTGRSLFSFVPG